MRRKVSVILLIIFLLSIYAVLNIDLDWLWSIGYNTNADKINKVISMLSSGFITGYFVFFLSIEIPYYYDSCKFKPIIKNEIESLATKFSNILVGFPCQDEKLCINIKDKELCKKIMEEADWNSDNNLPIYPENKRKLYQTFFLDYVNITKHIGRLINDYSSYLTTEQLLLLEGFRNVKFLSTLEVLNSTNVKFPTEGQGFIIQEYIPLLDRIATLRKTIE